MKYHTKRTAFILLGLLAARSAAQTIPNPVCEICGCSFCAEGEFPVGNPVGAIPIPPAFAEQAPPGFTSVPCSLLDIAGTSGQIPTEVCNDDLRLLPEFRSICGCPPLPPVVPPTPQPVVRPTPRPVVPPTPRPVVPPTAKPVVPPTPRPVATPTAKPVVPPTPRPVVAPNAMPVTAPVAGDTKMPAAPPVDRCVRRQRRTKELVTK